MWKQFSPVIIEFQGRLFISSFHFVSNKCRIVHWMSMKNVKNCKLGKMTLFHEIEGNESIYKCSYYLILRNFSFRVPRPWKTLNKDKQWFKKIQFFIIFFLSLIIKMTQKVLLLDNENLFLIIKTLLFHLTYIIKYNLRFSFYT